MTPLMNLVVQNVDVKVIAEQLTVVDYNNYRLLSTLELGKFVKTGISAKVRARSGIKSKQNSDRACKVNANSIVNMRTDLTLFF